MESIEYRLKVDKGPLSNREFSFNKKVVHIGSSFTQNDLILNIEGISAQHARIWQEEQTYYIEGLSDDIPISIDGTALRKKEPFNLKSKSRIDFGTIVFKFIDGPEKTILADQTLVFKANFQEDDKVNDRFLTNWKRFYQPKIIFAILGLLLLAIFSVSIIFKSPKPEEPVSDVPKSATDKVHYPIDKAIAPPDQEACNLPEAEKLFNFGEEFYNQKSISKGNLYLAYKYYCDAIENMESCQTKKDIYSQAESKRDKSKNEIDQLYMDLRLSFKNALKVNDYSKAKNALKDITEHIPDKSDQRHKDAAKALEKFNEVLDKNG